MSEAPRGVRRPAPPEICAYPECGRQRFATEWCSGHYYMQLRSGSPPSRPLGRRRSTKPRLTAKCEAPWCNRTQASKGLCRACYGFKARTGLDPRKVDAPRQGPFRRRWVSE